MLGLKLVHRTILWELLKVFSLALVGLTSLLLLAGLVQEASQHGLSPGQIASVIPLLLPNMLPYTLPTTTLFATCIVYGRLAADNEILAIKAAGVHIGHVVWPAVLLGAAVSGATAFLYYEIIPETHHQLRAHVFDDIENYLYSILRKEGRLQHPKINYEIHVNQVDGDILRDALFRRIDPKTGSFDITAWAREAKLRVDRERNTLWIDMRNCIIGGDNGDGGRVHGDETKSWPVDLPAEFTGEQQKMRATDMTWAEMDEQRIGLVDKIAALQAQIDAHQAVINQAGPNPEYENHIRHLTAQMRMYQLLISAIDAEKHMRPAIALGCLCFVLVGCPIGIWFSKSDYLSAFISCFLPIILIYYPLLLSSINVAKGLKVTPLVIWSANAVVLLVGLTLFRRLARH